MSGIKFISVHFWNLPLFKLTLSLGLRIIVQWSKNSGRYDENERIRRKRSVSSHSHHRHRRHHHSRSRSRSHHRHKRHRRHKRHYRPSRSDSYSSRRSYSSYSSRYKRRKSDRSRTRSERSLKSEYSRVSKEDKSKSQLRGDEDKLNNQSWHLSLNISPVPTLLLQFPISLFFSSFFFGSFHPSALKDTVDSWRVISILKN